MSPIFKFSLIIIFFIATFLYKNVLNKIDLYLLRTGMFFTVLADLYLIIFDKEPTGVFLFCIVQIIYIVRYDVENFNKSIKILTVSLIFLLVFYKVLGFINISIDLIVPLSIFYLLCLGYSIYKSYKAYYLNKYPSPNKYLIVWGMTLFALCDINVGLSFIGFARELTSNLIWIFYLPSQFILSISGYKFSDHIKGNFHNQ